MYDRDRPSLSKDNENVNIVDLYSFESVPRTDNSYAQWLTNGEWDQEKYTLYMLALATPGLGRYTQFLTDWHDDMDYMKNNQIDWDDVKRPWKLKSSSSGAAFFRSGINFISSNVKRLYR